MRPNLRSGWAIAFGVVVLLLVVGLVSEDRDGRSPDREGRPSSERADEDSTGTRRKGGEDGSSRANKGASGSKEGRSRRRGAGIPGGAKRTTVREVTDGDTVVLAGLGPSRLIGVDTPEVHGGSECYGPAASAYTGRRLSPGTTVFFRLGAERVDRYGRSLVYVWLAGGSFFNAELVKDGFATPLAISPNVDFAPLFDRLASTARRRGIGLWSACGGNPGGSGGASGSGGSAGRSRGGGGSSGGDRDCADFSSQAEAQDYFEAKGGPGSDPDRLDGDSDGIACETLP